MNESPSTDIAALREALEKCKARSNESWLASLNSRKVAESQFHNEWRDDPEKSLPVQKYYSTANLSGDYVHDWIKKNVPGKIFLDYACGPGTRALEAGKMGAGLSIGLDISPSCVHHAEQKARDAGLSGNTFFMQGDCENTGLPNNSIDVILCSGMLHHLDLSYAFPELRRILKPGGKILAVEALRYNPVFQLYRMLTPSLRTVWEKHHILTLGDVRFAKRFFEVRQIRYWHLFSLMSVLLRRTPLFRPALAMFNAIDRVVLRIPPISYMAWIFTFEMVKREDK
jgi:SAM-dependent methyltransferase